MSKVLIVGNGSIGKKHSTVFEKLGAAVGVVSSREVEKFQGFATLAEAIEQFSPDSILISNETRKHLETLQEARELNFTGPVYIEKPLDSDYTEKDLPENGMVLYNLRMNPLLKKMRELVADAKVVSVNIYCGQYLPEWRPDRDYRTTYSAKRSEGGGVLRDLSHELDYCQWLFGKFSSVAAVGGGI